MKGEPRISGIYHRANPPPPAGIEAQRRNKEARADVWHRLGLAVIDPTDIEDDWLRQAILNEATRLYGRRR